MLEAESAARVCRGLHTTVPHRTGCLMNSGVLFFVLFLLFFFYKIYTDMAWIRDVYTCPIGRPRRHFMTFSLLI